MLPCTKCAYRRSIPGDAHTRCAFDWTLEGKRNQKRMTAFSKIKAVVPSHALQWFRFPINYDPTWGPDKCEEFSTKSNKKDIKESYSPMIELISFF